MKRFFLYLSGWNGRITRCVIGLLLLAAGFYGEIYPVNLVLFIAGLIVFSAGTGNFLILAPLFGFPFWGRKMQERYGASLFAQRKARRRQQIRKDPGKSNSGALTAEVKTGSTTQGGSNFGQGSSYLAHDAQQQGKEKNRGANYDNETGTVAE